jgi:CBS domain-containing protein
LVEDLPTDEIAHLAERMAPDEAADFIGDLDESKSAEVLAAMEPDGREEIVGLLRHEEDTAGGLMTTEVVSCTERELAGVVRDRAVRAELSDPVLYVYVVAPEDGKLLGYVSLHDLIAANPDLPVGGMANRDYVFSVTTEDQQEVARRFRRYDLWVMPVVDERHRLVGRVTVDDVIDVVHEEADEDLAHMAGAPDIEEEEESPLRIARLRLPWLLITMFAGLLNSVVIRAMMHVTTQEMLAIFVPPILAMGGNTLPGFDLWRAHRVHRLGGADVSRAAGPEPAAPAPGVHGGLGDGERDGVREQLRFAGADSAAPRGGRSRLGLRAVYLHQQRLVGDVDLFRDLRRDSGTGLTRNATCRTPNILPADGFFCWCPCASSAATW